MQINPIIIFDYLGHANKPQLDLATNLVADDRHFVKGGVLPDPKPGCWVPDDVRDGVRIMRDAGYDTYVVDIEDSRYETIAGRKAVSELLHLIRAHGMKVGTYGIGPVEGTQSYEAPLNHYRYPNNPQTWTTWQKDNKARQEMSEICDVLTPSLYERKGDLDDLDRWRYVAYGTIQELRRLHGNKPIIPFLSPNVAAKTANPELKADTLLEMIELCRQLGCSGVVLWLWPQHGQPLVWDANSELAKALKRLMP